MQIVNEKVPATRVAKVSELRMLQDIDDNAYLLVVQNGRGFKTTYGELKKKVSKLVADEMQKIFQQKVAQSESFAQKMSQKTDQFIEENSRKTAEISSNLQSAKHNVESLSASVDMYEQHNDANLEDIKNAFAADKQALQQFQLHTHDAMLSIQQSIANNFDSCNNADIALSSQLSGLEQLVKDFSATAANADKQLKNSIEENVGIADRRCKQIETVLSASCKKYDDANDNTNEMLQVLSRSVNNINSTLQSIDSNFNTALAESKSSVDSKIDEFSRRIAMFEGQLSTMHEVIEKQLARQYDEEVSEDK